MSLVEFHCLLACLGFLCWLLWPLRKGGVDEWVWRLFPLGLFCFLLVLFGCDCGVALGSWLAAADSFVEGRLLGGECSMSFT